MTITRNIQNPLPPPIPNSSARMASKNITWPDIMIEMRATAITVNPFKKPCKALGSQTRTNRTTVINRKLEITGLNKVKVPSVTKDS
jgi:hypothetical protein